VRIERSIVGADPVLGYVIAVGSQWTLLSAFSAGSPNGWILLRIADVTSVDVASEGRFVRRGLEFQRSWPARAPDTELSLSGDVRALIESAAEYFPLVTLYVENQHPGSFVVGRPIRWTLDRVGWQELSPDAAWESELTMYELAQITRVDVGGQYATALARIADLRG
jgi:hypothetical protein